MWIFAAGMQRSGSTLQYQILCDLVECAGIVQRHGWCGQELHEKILERSILQTCESLKRINIPLP